MHDRSTLLMSLQAQPPGPPRDPLVPIGFEPELLQAMAGDAMASQVLYNSTLWWQHHLMQDRPEASFAVLSEKRRSVLAVRPVITKGACLVMLLWCMILGSKELAALSPSANAQYHLAFNEYALMQLNELPDATQFRALLSLRDLLTDPHGTLYKDPVLGRLVLMVKVHDRDDEGGFLRRFMFGATVDDEVRSVYIDRFLPVLNL